MLTEIQKEIITGALLGDGSLQLYKKSVNAHFAYSSKNKDHVEFIAKHFLHLCNDNPIKLRSSFDKRTNKTYHAYYFRTKANPDLTDLYYTWYKNKIKNIPPFITLTKLSMLIWYLGDGHLHKRDNYIKLCTNCFDINDITTILLPQLHYFNPRIIMTEKRQPIIIIPRKYVKQFLQFIGNCPVSSYTYKWEFWKEYLLKKYSVWTENRKQYMSMKMKGRNKGIPNPLSIQHIKKANQKIACPHCNMISNYGNIHRWHLDKCKYKKVSI